jgi:hypothetical protein
VIGLVTAGLWGAWLCGPRALSIDEKTVTVAKAGTKKRLEDACKAVGEKLNLEKKTF